MYQFTSILCIFALCISCIKSAPPAPTLLSALLSPPSASASSAYDAAATSSAAAAAAAAESSSSHGDRRETGLTTYDQKQSGKYNIHLNIKDVAIIALDAGGVDSGLGDSGQDYYEDYDLADFTVKPVFGLIEITSNKPSANATEAPPLIHFDSLDDWMANATSANQNADGSTNKTVEEPILKDPIDQPVKKPQTLEILNGAQSSSTAASIVSSTSSAINQKQTAIPLQFPIPLQPNQIPVQVVLDDLPVQQKAQSGGRQRPNASWRLRQRATPSHSLHHRRITPPHSGFEDSSHFAASASSTIGNNKYRKNSLSHAHRRNCIVDQNGQCQNSQRRFGSPTLNGILSLLSFLSPQQMEKLD